MGFRESLITDWKHSTMQYQGKRMWIAEQFEYEGKTYLYAVDEETFDKDILDVAFLYKVDDDIFANVSDEQLFQELLGFVAGVLVRKEIEEIKKQHNL